MWPTFNISMIQELSSILFMVRFLTNRPQTSQMYRNLIIFVETGSHTVNLHSQDKNIELTSTVSKSPRREDCKSFSSFSSLLLELDMPLITQNRTGHRHLSMTAVQQNRMRQKTANSDYFSPLSLYITQQPLETSCTQPLP